MQIVSALVAGLIFGIGLIISGMTNPLKVQNFLDVFGTWDPSLAFVMGGAIAVTAPGLWLLQKRSAPLFAQRFQLPTRNDFDTRLVLGAALFGIGWGMAGLCPGPAITAVPLGLNGLAIFVPAMLAGMALAKLAAPRAPSATTKEAAA